MTARRAPAALVLAVATVATSACFVDYPGFHALTAAADMADGTVSTTGAPPTSPTSGTDSSASDSAASDGAASDGATVDASTGTTGAEAGSVGDAELLPPRILGVEVPAAVHLAGPVDVLVEVEHATAVRATLDGVELLPFEDQGGGVWLGLAPCYGSVDNGDHVVEVSATHGPLAASWPPVPFTVSTPAPGGQAWAVLAPPASTTRRAAATAEGDLIEVGAVEVEGVMKPAIRKRSAANGGEMWAEGTIVLDTREGSADAIAVRADGWMWVAMNVVNPNKKWQPRIVLLDADGHATGIEAPTEPGATVRGIGVTDDGGFFAVGFGGSGLGDMDVVYWRMSGEDVATASAKLWDYLPPNDMVEPHEFDDLAFDVVVADGVAWVVGASSGKHDIDQVIRSRGVVVPLDVNTGAALGPALVAEPVNAGWRRSMFLAAGHHPDGVAAVGNETTEDGTMQRITVQAFDGSKRTHYTSELPASVAYGTGVAWTAHGALLFSGVVHNGDGLRGALYGRELPGLNFDHFIIGTEPSAANGLALDAYEQVYLVGERTLGGVRQARASRVAR
ncbi:hypothetical protein [Nannocystis bainbridge]|uniref:Uncharacterized protein n=1 Tax=Nannocystis bainbridge TaxID=2995303 RepID=A0ABT5E245_9BACT|nr:hypothetical protein [Nannocystis bainbridge]MDC0719937.1 hypothetical protein [Nannocystis bainbridge]